MFRSVSDQFINYFLPVSRQLFREVKALALNIFHRSIDIGSKHPITIKRMRDHPRLKVSSMTTIKTKVPMLGIVADVVRPRQSTMRREDQSDWCIAFTPRLMRCQSVQQTDDADLIDR